jgi:hypothetical protein
MRRKLEEVLASQRTMLNRTGAANSGTDDTQLAKLFEAELNAFYQWASHRPYIRLIDIDYNQVLREPRAVLKTVNEFLGGRLNVDAMVQVVDESLYRHRTSW